jgi:hypothetical protein
VGGYELGRGDFRGPGLTWAGNGCRSRATRRGLGSRSRSGVTWRGVGAKWVLWAVRDGRGGFSRCRAHLG